MELHVQNPGLRKGKFIWMEPSARICYVQSLKEKIRQGYYYSDIVVSKVVDEIAPILEEVACRD